MLLGLALVRPRAQQALPGAAVPDPVPGPDTGPDTGALCETGEIEDTRPETP